MSVRYFPVSQDINADEEVWELTDKFGVSGLRAWLEILSIADRNNGALPGRWEKYPSILAGRCKSTTRHLVTVCQFITRWLVVDSQGIARVANYAKYHKTRAERGLAPNLPNLTKPNLTKSSKKNSSNPPPIQEAVLSAQLLSDLIARNFPTRTAPTEAQLISWARDAEKVHRIDHHPWAEILELIEWSQDDTFWRSNILSMSKFREKWNQLTAKKESGNGRQDNRPAEPKGFAVLREIARKHNMG